MRTGQFNSIVADQKVAVRILHVSDFHFGKARQWDADPVLDGLGQAVSDLTKHELSPDVVAVTGDVANFGRDDEYALAHQWIAKRLRKALPGFRKNRLLFVAGNHDVLREEVNYSAKAIQQSLLNGCDHYAVANVLQDPGQRGNLLSRHAAFMRFANVYRSPKEQLQVPWWRNKLSINNISIHFAGLCSSWASYTEHEYGHLLVGKWQVQEVLRGSEMADFCIVLVHHPWWFLREFDQDAVERTVHQHADLVLRGHLHRQKTRIIQEPGNGCVELEAGAVYDGSDYANAFQLVELLPNTRQLRVHYRVWHQGKWIHDKNLYSSAPDGIAVCDLTPVEQPLNA